MNNFYRDKSPKRSVVNLSNLNATNSFICHNSNVVMGSAPMIFSSNTPNSSSFMSISPPELNVCIGTLNKSNESLNNRIKALDKVNDICEKRISSALSKRKIVNISSSELDQLVTGCAVQFRHINLTTQNNLNQNQVNSFTSQLGKLMKQIASIQKLFGVDISSKCFVDLVDSFLLYSRQDCQQMHKQLCELLNPFSRVSFDPNLILLALLQLLNDYAKIHVENLEDLSVSENIKQINNLLLEVMLFFNKESMVPVHLDEILYEIYNLFETYKDTVVFEQNHNPMNSLKSFVDFVVQKEGSNVWTHLELVYRETQFGNDSIELIRYLKSHDGLVEPKHEEEDDFEMNNTEDSNAEQINRERINQERLNQERLNRERLNQERLNQERLNQERLNQERLNQERENAERIARSNKLNAERVNSERMNTLLRNAERINQDRMNAQIRDAERINTERINAERLNAERINIKLKNSERLNAELQNAQRINEERINAERANAERIAAQLRNAEKINAELQRNAQRIIESQQQINANQENNNQQTPNVEQRTASRNFARYYVDPEAQFNRIFFLNGQFLFGILFALIAIVLYNFLFN